MDDIEGVLIPPEDMFAMGPQAVEHLLSHPLATMGSLARSDRANRPELADERGQSPPTTPSFNRSSS